MALVGVIKFFSMRAVEGVVAILLITFMPNLPPDAKYSLSYDLTPVLPFEGPLTLNTKLQGAEIWHKGDFHGPEAYAVYNGELYTTIHGGNVVKLIGEDIAPVVKFGKTCKGFYQEHLCGRPLGMQFDKNGNLYVADAYYGIFKVDVKTGKQVQLVSMDEEVNGKKPRLPNSVAVASNGDVYWTDSSTEFFLYDGVLDMLADGSGRLIHYDAKNKKNTVLIDKVHFANGIKLAADESFVLVSETARCRVHRYYLKGPKKGTHDIFLDGLPGLPDNIQTDGKDGFIIPLVVGRDDDHPPPLNIFGPFPLTRKFFSRIMGLTELGFKLIDQIYPSEWAERGVHYIGHFASLPHSWSSPRQTILHISKDGEILDSIHSLDASVIGMSEAFIYKDMLYMGSPFNDHVARIPLAKVGWEHLTLKESDYPSSKTVETSSSSSSPTEEPKFAGTLVTDAPRVTISQPTQAPRVIIEPPPPKEGHVHKREAPNVEQEPVKPTTAAPADSKPTAPAPPPPEPVASPKPATPTPTPKPTVPAPPPSPAASAAKPAAPAPAPKPSAPAPAPKPAQPAPATKPAAPAPPPKPASAPKPAAPATAPKPAAPSPAPKPAAPAPAPKSAAPAPAPKPAAPAPTPKPAAPAPAPKPAAPAPTPKPAAPAPTPKPAAPAPAPKPAAPAPKPAAPAPKSAAPAPAPKPAAPAPAPKPAAPAPKPAAPAPAPKPAAPAPAPKPAAPTPAPKPAAPAPAPKPAAPAPAPKPAAPAPASKPAAPAPAPKPVASAPTPKPSTPSASQPPNQPSAQQQKVVNPSTAQEPKIGQKPKPDEEL